MQLTRYTDYAFRMLVFLSLKESDTRITINDIAQHFDIPLNHLIKVAQRLGQLGYVQTTRGRGGGVSLRMETKKIRIGDVVRQMEPRLNVVNCNQPACPILPECKLRGVLDKARDAFLESIDRYSLADIQQHPSQLRVLLHIS